MTSWKKKTLCEEKKKQPRNIGNLIGFVLFISVKVENQREIGKSILGSLCSKPWWELQKIIQDGSIIIIIII